MVGSGTAIANFSAWFRGEVVAGTECFYFFANLNLISKPSATMGYTSLDIIEPHFTLICYIITT